MPRRGRGPVPGMTSRKLLTAIAATALYAVVLVTSASAEMHRVQVTLVTGQIMTVTVDVPPGTPVEQVQIPGLPAAVQQMVDLGPVADADRHADADGPTARRPKSRPPEPDPDAGQPAGRRVGGGSGGGNSGGGDGSTHAPARDENKRQPRRPERAVVRGPRQGQGPGHRRRRRPHREQADGRRAPRTRHTRLRRPGPARIGVPNFFIDKFRIPPFLLPIYQAAGIQYGVRWEILAAINEIETDYGRNLNVSSAGAVGWMQFLPSTWRLYGVDANGDRVKDPYNPVDAIFAAARYLRAAGADKDIRRAVFAYNHADWYVDSVLLRAQVIGGLPSNLVGSLTGLTQGRFPVQARATYAGQLGQRASACRRATPRWSSSRPAGPASASSRATARRRSPPTTAGSCASAKTQRLGRYVMLQDVYGNTYTYGHLDKVARRYPAPKPQRRQRARTSSASSRCPRATRRPSSRPPPPSDAARRAPERKLAERAAPKGRKPAQRPPAKERLFANPTRPNAAAAGGAQQEFERTGVIDGVETFEGYFNRLFGLDRRDDPAQAPAPGRPRGRRHDPRPHRPGPDRGAPHLLFEIRPGRARRPARSTRSRSSTAGSCSSRPRSTAPPARTRSSAPTRRTRRSARSC